MHPYSKPLKAIQNNVGGYDLLTERDSGNEIRILTGRPEYSLDYWQRLADLAERVIQQFEDIKPNYHPKQLEA